MFDWSLSCCSGAEAGICRGTNIIPWLLIDVVKLSLPMALTVSGNSLQWRHNELGGVSYQWRLDCLLNRLFRRRSKKTSKLHVTSFCEGNPPVTGGFPSQRASYAEKVSIWWRYHAIPVVHDDYNDLHLLRVKNSKQCLFQYFLFHTLRNFLFCKYSLHRSHVWHRYWTRQLVFRRW